MYISEVSLLLGKLIRVPGDKIVTPAAIVQLVFETRLATEQDYQSGLKRQSKTESTKDDSDEDEADIDILIGRKKRDDGEPVPMPLAHAPYFPFVRRSFMRYLTRRSINLVGGLFWLIQGRVG